MIFFKRKLFASLAKHARVARHITRQDTLRELKKELVLVQRLLLNARAQGKSLSLYEEQVFRIKKIIEEKENNW